LLQQCALPVSTSVYPSGGTLATISDKQDRAVLEKVTYDPIEDFAPITLVDRSPSILVVHPRCG